jgi:hypothetical protein
LVDNGNGPFFKIVESTRTLATNECAERLIVTPAVRNIVFDETIVDSSCNLAGMSSWKINKLGADALPTIPFLLRASDEDNVDCSTVTAVSLTQYVRSLVDFYEQKIVKLDAKWALEAKAHIEAIDAKARTILSNLADTLTRCESTLAGTEFGITFQRCDPNSPATPSTLSVAEDGMVDNMEISGQEWEILT